jgi:hypothetical protein
MDDVNRMACPHPIGSGHARLRRPWQPVRRWSAVVLAAWRAAVLITALPAIAWASATPCGQPGVIGLASTAELTGSGELVATLTLTDAPVAAVSVRPLVFADGVLVESGAPLRLACGEEVGWSVPAERLGRVAHAVHWTVLAWPPIAPAVAALDADAAIVRFGERALPGLYPWRDVETLRPPGAAPWPREVRAAPAWVDEPERAGVPPDLVDDAVEWWVEDGGERRPRLARAAAGSAQRFVLQYLPGEHGGGPLVVTCLLDRDQIDAFDGRPFVLVEAVAGRLLVLEGEIVVPGPGWHRLHCLLLPDDAGERPATWPRPLLAAYLWGEP